VTILSILLWAPAIAIKILLALLGLVVVPFTDSDNPIYGNNEHPTPPKWYRPGQPEWWRDYVWRAIRNPVNNLRYYFDEPEPEVIKGHPNPDNAVRKEGRKSAHRFTRASLYSEYWYLRKTGDRFLEFRVGWKFSGVPGFAPTIQLRYGTT